MYCHVRLGVIKSDMLKFKRILGIVIIVIGSPVLLFGFLGMLVTLFDATGVDMSSLILSIFIFLLGLGFALPGVNLLKPKPSQSRPSPIIPRHTAPASTQAEPQTVEPKPVTPSPLPVAPAAVSPAAQSPQPHAEIKPGTGAKPWWWDDDEEKRAIKKAEERFEEFTTISQTDDDIPPQAMAYFKSRVGVKADGPVYHLKYRDAEGRETERDIEPLGIKRGGEYKSIMAFCHLACDIRQFRFDRILSLTLYGRPISTEDSFKNLQDYQEHHAKKIATDALDDEDA